ncbi:MAG: diphthamide biosynthesis protein [Cenarchaeum symbiont of Oopsacas minuta]|nr:diphthamide biosynthesis protein [Cenarchaeum symbiont of Oopsacas minuta]
MCKLRMIVIDEESIFKEIKEREPVSVAINGPDGILLAVQSTATKISEKFGIPVYVLADTTWGSCDLNSNGAQILGADVLFNIGHTIGIPIWDKRVVMIDAFDDISFDRVAKKSAKMFHAKTVSLVTDSQHLHQVDLVRKILEEGGAHIIVGKGKGQLNDGQVFGCEFYPAKEAAQNADVNVFLGQSDFHAAGLALSTGLATYILDPYFNEVREVTEMAQKIQKKATLAIYAAAEMQTFGVIVGLKEGQLSKTTALKFKKELEECGKSVQLFAMTDINNERLHNLRGIDAFVQVACPRIATDNEFDMPVLSTPQALALIRVLRGEQLGDYLQIPHWL